MGAVGSTPASSATGSGSAANSTASNIAFAQQSLASNQSTFLTLLTTQLRHQDPLSPMDTNTFTQQLVAMTGVQQQILTNQLLQQLVGNQTAAGDPVNMIGKTVSATDAQATLQKGSATWQYSTAGAARDVQLQVKNALGQVVYATDAGALAAGQHSFAWNGKDSSGLQLPDGGTYTLDVVATDASGGSVSSSVFQSGVVSAVDLSNGKPSVVVNGDAIPASQVISVSGS
jgi:flagellar basal-body rod modification protein FlgD